jgi:hypothetical protein
MKNRTGGRVFKKRNISIALGTLLIIFLCVPQILSQERIKSVQISRTEEPPKIDGQIEDSCWKNIQPISGFFQHDPVNGAAASEETLVWMAYDDKNIYLAFLMKDSQPYKIWAELTPRNGHNTQKVLLFFLVLEVTIPFQIPDLMLFR